MNGSVNQFKLVAFFLTNFCIQCNPFSKKKQNNESCNNM